MSYLLRRLLANLWQVVAVSLLSFYLFSIVPGDFYSAERFNPQHSANYLDQLQRESGLKLSWPSRYLVWMQSCVSSDCGTSLAHEVGVRQLLGPRLAKTMMITIPGLLLAWILGLTFALLSIRRQNGPGSAPRGRPNLCRLARIRSPLTPLAATAAMVPDVISIAILLWGSVRLGLPISGIWLPVTGMVFALTPIVFLHAANSLEYARELPFVLLAKQRGVMPTSIWLRYILPAAAGPLVSLAGLSFTAAIGSSLLIEVLAGWPGLGPLFLESVQTRDYPVVQTTVVLLAVVLSCSNLLADLALYRLDPRIRVRH